VHVVDEGVGLRILEQVGVLQALMDVQAEEQATHRVTLADSVAGLELCGLPAR
jgi:hypothetical protein